MTQVSCLVKIHSNENCICFYDKGFFILAKISIIQIKRPLGMIPTVDQKKHM